MREREKEKKQNESRFSFFLFLFLFIHFSIRLIVLWCGFDLFYWKFNALLRIFTRKKMQGKQKQKSNNFGMAFAFGWDDMFNGKGQPKICLCQRQYCVYWFQSDWFPLLLQLLNFCTVALDSRFTATYDSLRPIVPNGTEVSICRELMLHAWINAITHCVNVMRFVCAANSAKTILLWFDQTTCTHTNIRFLNDWN